LSEAIFCDDHNKSVLEMGDQLVREGPALRAQKEAAAIFGTAFVSMQLEKSRHGR
jgi:ornithine decarboxylase